MQVLCGFPTFEYLPYWDAYPASGRARINALAVLLAGVPFVPPLMPGGLSGAIACSWETICYISNGKGALLGIGAHEERQYWILRFLRMGAIRDSK